MKKCSNPDHPHCTLWVMPGETACASGHVQGTTPLSSFELVSELRGARPDRDDMPSGEIVPAPAGAPLAAQTSLPHPHLHVSGFDPRAAGGRQAIKVELRGMAPDAAPQ